MADFRTRRIRQKPPLKIFKNIKNGLIQCVKFIFNVSKKQRSYLLGFVLVAIGAFVVIKVSIGIYHKIDNINTKDVVFALGSELKQDKYGYTNIVLLGDGGHVRDGADLIDTIIVASIDFKGESVALISIPRDYYLRYIPDKEFADRKINEVYRDFKKEFGEEDAYAIYQKVAGGIVGLDIQYYARVDFNAFVEVVDSLEGITVDVKERIYDPNYPNETDDGYAVFEIDAGPQEMNGETALKFVRSRKSTSDFDRAARQQQVLIAIRDKAMSSGINPKTIKQLYQSVRSNINTNLTLREMIALASFGKDFDRENLVMKVLRNNDPVTDGSFLHTPERQYYNGQFVLVPDGNSLDLIHRYANLIFNQREVLMHPVRIEVLNATKKSGIAREAAVFLERFGLNIVNIDNLYDKEGEKKYVEKSFIRYNSWEVDAAGNVIAHYQPTLNALTSFVKGESVPIDEISADSKADISIVFGDDYEIY